MAINTQLKKARKAAKLTQKKLGEKLGLAEITIRQYENNKRIPTFDTMLKIAEILNTDIYFLLEIPTFPTDPSLFEALHSVDCNTAAMLLKQHYYTVNPKNYASQTIDDLEIFFLYLESLNYKLTILDIDEMKQWNIQPIDNDDFYIGIQDNKSEIVTFFHKSEFISFQQEVDNIISDAIDNRFHKPLVSK